MLKLIAVVPLAGGLVAQAAGGTDPALGLFTSLGVSGAVAVVLYLWQRDTAKQRDKAMESLATLQPLMVEIQHALNKSNEAHVAGTEATKAITAALREMPAPEVWFRIVAAIERREREQS